MPKVEEQEMPTWLDLKAVLTVAAMMLSGFSAYTALKSDLAAHEVRLAAVERNIEWQWRTIDALRTDVSELKENVAAIRARVEQIK